jgi:hypothetical protein
MAEPDDDEETTHCTKILLLSARVVNVRLAVSSTGSERLTQAVI